jgi:hypothetical protein
MNDYINRLEKIVILACIIAGITSILLALTVTLIPEQLDNGCLVFDNKVYCEEVSK